jgi:hypothetical protein
LIFAKAAQAIMNRTLLPGFVPDFYAIKRMFVAVFTYLYIYAYLAVYV